MKRIKQPPLIAILVFLVLFAVGCGAGGDAQTSATTTLEPPAAATTTTAPTTAFSSYTFAVCGDNRITGIENGILQKIVDSAKANGAPFIVNTGDITTSGTREELWRYREFTEASGIRFYNVPGNHDVGKGGVNADYESVIGPYYYSFDYGGDHFVVLDNADDATGIDAAQTQWYTAGLDSHKNQRRQFIFTHIPVASPSLPSGHVAGEKGNAGFKSGQQLVQEASRHANVDAMFFGHIHAYVPYRLDGVDAYITGGAGAPLYFPENAGGFYHYLLVKVSDEKVEVQVVRV